MLGAQNYEQGSRITLNLKHLKAYDGPTLTNSEDEDDEEEGCPAIYLSFTIEVQRPSSAIGGNKYKFKLLSHPLNSRERQKQAKRKLKPC